MIGGRKVKLWGESVMSGRSLEYQFTDLLNGASIKGVLEAMVDKSETIQGLRISLYDVKYVGLIWFTFEVLQVLLI